MMLKDKFAKFFDNSKKEKDPLKVNIMDGFVDIKGYKVKEDGSKKLVYHDCGDNVVTDWMRQVLMLALTGTIFSAEGNKELGDLKNPKSVTTITDLLNHNNGINNGINNDGYILNSKQFFWKEESDKRLKKYSSSNIPNNTYSLFPTKVLFGTGKEYSSWEMLKSDNETANNNWYKQMVFEYGGDYENVEGAKETFDKHINDEINKFSGTIAKGINSGDGSIINTHTVNINSSLDVEVTNSSTNRSVGVVGAIKTNYFNENSDKDKIIKNDGTLLPEWKGTGRPCFIYFRTPTDSENKDIVEEWNKSSSDIFLSKDNDSKFINKITFKINMPAQSAAENVLNAFYPYNGYTLRQVGLYNDALFKNNPAGTTSIEDDKYLSNNMPCGTLLAIKNIAPLEKNKDIEFVMTWTLTI